MQLHLSSVLVQLRKTVRRTSATVGSLSIEPCDVSEITAQGDKHEPRSRLSQSQEREAHCHKVQIS